MPRFAEAVIPISTLEEQDTDVLVAILTSTQIQKKYPSGCWCRAEIGEGGYESVVGHDDECRLLHELEKRHIR